MINKNYWTNKKVLITGGTAGLGKALSDQLKALGAQIAISARTPGAGIIQANMSLKEDMHRLYSEALNQLGQIDVLFNNASTLGVPHLKLLLDTDCEDFELALQTNLLGPFRLIKLVAAEMLIREEGLIVNITSDAAIHPYSKWGAYGTSKAALDHMTRIFEAELKSTGVRMMLVDPGDMNTALHLTALPNADIQTLFDPADSARLIIENIANKKYDRRNIR